MKTIVSIKASSKFSEMVNGHFIKMKILSKFALELCRKETDHNSIQKPHEAPRIPSVVFDIFENLITSFSFSFSPMEIQRTKMLK